MQVTKVDIETEIEELTRGAVVQEFLDKWTGKKMRIELGLKLARNRWGECVYGKDELVQIRDWLRAHLWRERQVGVWRESDLARRPLTAVAGWRISSQCIDV